MDNKKRHVGTLGLYSLTILLVLLFALSAKAQEQKTPVAEKEEKITNDSSFSSDALNVGINQFVRLVRERNDRIRYHRFDWEISEQGVIKNKAIFEPELVTGAGHESNYQRNTAEEATSRSSLDEFKERNYYYDTAVESKLITGAKLSFGAKMKDLSNNLQEFDSEESDYNEYKSFIGLNVVQPLLKNLGKDATMADTRVAEAESKIAYQRYRKEMLAVVEEAVAAYWDLFGQQEKFKIREDSVRIGETILADNRIRVREGRMAETEILEAEASLALRKSLVSAARQDIASAVNQVRGFLFASATGRWEDIKVIEPLPITEEAPILAESLKRTFSLRPEYLAGKIKIALEDIRLAYHENQNWPQLDMKMSYGLNGLADQIDDSWDDAFSADHESWSVGLELRIPLGGGKRAASELTAANLRKQQSLLELKATEVALTNIVDTRIKNVFSSMDQLRQFQRIVDHNQRLLEVELERLAEGRSTSRQALEKEEALIRVKEDALNRSIALQKAIVALKKAEGSLLLHYGLTDEVEKVDSEEGDNS